jgi:hypothetical protein
VTLPSVHNRLHDGALLPDAGRLPDLFIIGAAKSGTTSLYFWLAGHPEIYMSAVKEPNYFAPDLMPPGPHLLKHPDDQAKYLELFAPARDAIRAGEASVRYLYSRVAPSLIARVQPRPYLVVALRNPVEMAFSLYLHWRARGFENLVTFGEAVAAEEDRHAGRRIPAGANPHLATYLDRASYGEQLPRWIETFGRERLHVIVFEEMVADPARDFHRLLEFLDVDPDYRPTEFRAYNPAHAGRGNRLRRLAAHRVPQTLLWGPLATVIGDARVRSMTARARRSPAFKRRIERPTLDPGLRAKLEERFAPDVKRTSELVGRDLAAIWFSR